MFFFYLLVPAWTFLGSTYVINLLYLCGCVTFSWIVSWHVKLRVHAKTKTCWCYGGIGNITFAQSSVTVTTPVCRPPLSVGRGMVYGVYVTCRN